MPAAVNKSLLGAQQPSPTRTSPRKISQTRLYPTPLSMSPSTSSTATAVLRYPPSFDPHHTSSRYPSQQYTPYSPYRPGEYGRSERGLASERTKIERKLFDDEEGSAVRDMGEDGDKLMVVDQQRKGRDDTASSPLAPAFEAKMVLRNGASIDLISWLRTNFHHIPPPHTVLTPSMPLNGIRHLLLERFPRAPEVEELSKAVLAAFPHSQWDYPTGTSSEPPTIRGLVWHGKDIADEDEVDEPIKPSVRSSAHIHSRARLSTGTGTSKGKQTSRSPTQSTLVSPISSSKRHLPDTPARSVLEEFAEIATLAEKTPVTKAKSLPGEPLAPSPTYTFGNIAHAFDHSTLLSRKRPASQSPELGHRRRASTPDKLHGLLAAAEAVEGSPITSVLGHKRRRTIGGPGTARDLMNMPRRARSSRGTLSPPMRGLSLLPQVSEDIDYMVPLNDTASFASPHGSEEDAASNALPAMSSKRAATSSSASQSSIISQNLPTAASSSSLPSTTNSSSATGTSGGGGRKVNELPTDGDAPGYDCKPPYPYHEMIRHAIENAPDTRLQLSQIYSSIADRFPFFKTLDEKKTAGWQNSIRHNLSLKKMFVRVNKVDGVPDESGGKGGWWTVQPGVPDEGRPGRKAKAKKAKVGSQQPEEGAGGGEWIEHVNVNGDGDESAQLGEQEEEQTQGQGKEAKQEQIYEHEQGYALAPAWAGVEGVHAGR
ncbi:hypothetical protein CI109_104392 [Kwoniella shandongensis]|uniref:Uncharacterized protein n=1 Tax=Kwoniella shandongensis TaxID=1734106 RepID=A0A5M6BWY1_9TREE|nr:uncharacterized protein CI109_004209 [Kwoniella shandongensis]KAA5527396.1 hypothetical protein CI109_004209 [Kwoniella shandongensis]